jgi:hypothetical protein
MPRFAVVRDGSFQCGPYQAAATRGLASSTVKCARGCIRTARNQGIPLVFIAGTEGHFWRKPSRPAALRINELPYRLQGARIIDGRFDATNTTH